MHGTGSDRSSPRSPSSDVRVLRVDPGEPTVVKFLGKLQGLITHFSKRTGSVWCPGPEECPTATHRLGPDFKAYAPVEVWLEKEQVWRPRVLEATANLEQYLRGRRLRGEVWSLARRNEKNPKLPADKYSAVVGAFCERIDDDQLSPEFAIEPVLKRFFGEPRLVLGAVNPMPDKLRLADVKAQPPNIPKDLLPPPPPEEDPAEREHMEKAYREFRESFGAGGRQREREEFRQRLGKSRNGNGHV